ncbi:MAG TPA: metallopeptidase TldD-related protein [Thermomicrobiaceae bacterium]|nr:metallopeptidase TldD-related protein [Thermomicrobiaceae bacterium]
MTAEAGAAFFAARFGVDAQRCDELLGRALERGGDYADLFFEYSEQRRLALSEQQVRTAGSTVLQGLGVRVVSGESVGYAYTEQLDPASLRAAVDTAASVAKSGAPLVVPVRRVPVAQQYPAALALAEPAGALALLERADAAARAAGSSIRNVEVDLSQQARQILVATSEGRLAGDSQPMVRLVVSALSERDGDRQQGFEGKAGRAGLEFFSGERAAEAMGRRAAEEAIRQHEAVEAPAGFLPVVLAAGQSGVWLHEAVGHGLEADFNRRGLSTYSGRIGQQVASPLVTVVDDGTVPGLNGSLNVDDEGQEPRLNVLIERGVLRGYMHDWQSARGYGLPASGNGRRQDFRHAPMPRMTTTYTLAGETPPEEIIRAVDYGVYCVSFSGGQVDIASGDYTFATLEAYLIEHGRITAPIRTVNLIGNGPDSLTRVTLVGNDLQISEIAGMCGKGGKGAQWVPVGVGLPTVLVDGITVGGTKR